MLSYCLLSPSLCSSSSRLQVNQHAALKAAKRLRLLLLVVPPDEREAGGEERHSAGRGRRHSLGEDLGSSSSASERKEKEQQQQSRSRSGRRSGGRGGKEQVRSEPRPQPPVTACLLLSGVALVASSQVDSREIQSNAHLRESDLEQEQGSRAGAGSRE
eukprot:635207-Hanusia_phi.AAC.1